MDVIDANYNLQCHTWSDIYQLLPILAVYAAQCQHVTEMGMRSVVSSWALAKGLMTNQGKEMVSIDLDYSPNIEPLKNALKEVGINFIFVMGNDVKMTIDQTDLLFIDTFHVYAHLKEELRCHADKVNKYIICHDITVDGIYGEAIRNGWDAVQISKETGYRVEDINRGLQPAVDEFLASHPEWKIKELYTHCNGLLIMERVTNNL
jgi:hypothetical protein